MEAHILIVLLVAGLATVVAAMAVTAVAAVRLNRVAVVDITWGLGFVAIALVSAVVSTVLDEGDPVRRWVVLGLVTAWGLRLAWHVRRRAIGPHEGKEDPRYASMLGGEVRETGIGVAVRRVFAVQGTALWVISLPVMLGAGSDVEWWPLVIVGALVWATGLAFESIGDAQLAAYKEIPKDQRPLVMETGLWRYTRHPNYFGDATVWWGLWLVAGLASGWAIGLATLVAPIAMTYFLMFATGARLLEKTMMKREGYPEYAARTSMFFPLPPKKG